MTPQKKLSRIRASLGVNKIEKFPENVASDEVSHFMMITEYKFNNTNTKIQNKSSRIWKNINR